MSGNETYDQASGALEDYDAHAGEPGWKSDVSDDLEQAKYDASLDVSPWYQFWHP